MLWLFLYVYVSCHGYHIEGLLLSSGALESQANAGLLLSYPTISLAYVILYTHILNTDILTIASQLQGQDARRPSAERVVQAPDDLAQVPRHCETAAAQEDQRCLHPPRVLHTGHEAHEHGSHHGQRRSGT